MGKQEMRKQLAALSFSDKVRILEKLRNRSLAFAEARQKLKKAKDAHDRVQGRYQEENLKLGDTEGEKRTRPLFSS